jgi:hypothetical protein
MLTRIQFPCHTFGAHALFLFEGGVRRCKSFPAAGFIVVSKIFIFDAPNFYTRKVGISSTKRSRIFSKIVQRYA